jgi:tRNA A-37 threonylcarbamoyl transferase component Bud32/tetratricopeptide (TPR) repeat protein
MTARPDDSRPLTTHDFSRVEALFDEVSALNAADRESAIGSSLRDRPDLLNELHGLLAAHDALAAAAPSPEPADGRLDIGGSVGPYRLVERIGRGGMGEVFKAQRSDGAFDRYVAIKVMRSTGLDTDLVRRFRIERQILASLRHPNIVTLLDGGAAQVGPAYLVMELVNGTEIMRHCRDARLSLTARLELFRTLCAAVQYAHQHGVVHRDLKPANILIEPDGTLKVLDFGVAKLLQRTPESGETTHGVLPGPLTPNYASPEQLRGLPVTTASDVYSLGILLYELIADKRPYETKDLAFDRVLELVVTTDPKPASAAASHRHLRGDLDAIVMKAMSKDAARRYDSAGELGSDVARFLEGQPVVARAPSTGYIVGRLAARNKKLVVVCTLALIAVLGASGVAIWQRGVARQEQARADQRFREVRQLTNALIFKIHDAVAPLPGSTPVRRTIVDEALAYLERLERESGADDVTLRLELAAAYRKIGAILGDPQRPNLGDRDAAIAQYERGRALAVTAPAATSHFDAVISIVDADLALATLYNQKKQGELSNTKTREAVDVATRYAKDHPADERASKLVARANFQLAWSLPAEQAVPVWEQTLAYYENELKKAPASPEAQRNVALIAKYLGGTFENLQRHDLATPQYARAVELDEARLRAAPDSLDVRLDAAISIGGLAAVAAARDDLDEAARLFERSLAIRRSVVDADPKNVQARERLGYALFRSGQIQSRRGDLATGRQQLVDAVQLLSQLLQTTKDRSTQKILADAYLYLGETERSLHSRAACEAFRQADRHYRDSVFERTVNDDEHIAKAAREVTACRHSN